MELRARPKSDYMQRAAWADLHTLGKHWLSELDFYGDELLFLRHLIDKHFIWLVSDEKISHVQNIATKLSEADEEQKQLILNIKKHLKHLEELVENMPAEDEEHFRKEHANLEDKIVRFNKSFLDLKRDIFDITEHAIQEEKLKRLLAP